ncbi:MAG: hypothetical protein PVF17_00940 [Ignavibacteria bacterium]
MTEIVRNGNDYEITIETIYNCKETGQDLDARATLEYNIETKEEYVSSYRYFDEDISQWVETEECEYFPISEFNSAKEEILADPDVGTNEVYECCGVSWS